MLLEICKFDWNTLSITVSLHFLTGSHHTVSVYSPLPSSFIDSISHCQCIDWTIIIVSTYFNNSIFSLDNVNCSNSFIFYQFNKSHMFSCSLLFNFFSFFFLFFFSYIFVWIGRSLLQLQLKIQTNSMTKKK